MFFLPNRERLSHFTPSYPTENFKNLNRRNKMVDIVDCDRGIRYYDANGLNSVEKL